MKQARWLWLVAWAGTWAAAETAIEPLDRGVRVRTPAYEVDIRDGAVVRLYNALTREEYTSGRAEDVWRRQLPGGLATQAGEGARQAAAVLHTWPWGDPPIRDVRPNQHIADPESAFASESLGAKGVLLTYRNLTDGAQRYPDEIYRLRVEVEEATGELLLTPAAESPQAGVYGVCLQLGRLRPAVSVEAPIWDGVRITSDMPDCLWHNQWPSFWDFQFLALNGQGVGAFGLWAEDARFDYYKSLFFMVKDQTISLSLASFATPPFDGVKAVESVTWRLQAFETSWAQAAARYRAWRDGPAGIAIVKRPDYALKISAVTQLIWADEPTRKMVTDAWGELSDRFAVWYPTVRRQPFDQNHWDNTPYEKFKAGMAAWNEAGGPPTIAYLQPMIMLGAQNATTDEAKQIVRWSQEAHTITPFRDGKPHPYMDQNHLGHGPWQSWFLGVVKDWIQNYGTRGIYHDQSYICPVDSRGPIGGLNSVQGMADYFRKANTENPGSFHATEHLQEANLVGCSLGIGPLTLWGTEPAMRQQRIWHSSPVSAALQYPHAVTWHFTHDREGNGTATLVNWQSNMAESRAHIPYSRQPRRPGDAAELLVDAIRTETFVRFGLRPEFPEDWAAGVRSYFRSAAGEDFRYEKVGPGAGSRFVQIMPDGTRRVLYTRIHGVRHLATPGAVHGWVCYTDCGPSGLHPERFYVADPEAARPTTWLEPAFKINTEFGFLPHPYAAYIEDGGVNDYILWARVRPLYPDKAGPRTGESFLLHAPVKPVAVHVDGKAVDPAPGPQPNTWVINCGQTAEICVLRQPPETAEPTAHTLLARHANDFGCDRTVPAVLAAQVGNPKPTEVTLPDGAKAKGLAVKVPMGGHYSFVRTQFHAPFAAAADKEETVDFHQLPGRCELLVDGRRQKVADGTATVKIPAGQARVVSILRTLEGERHEAWAELPVTWRRLEAPVPEAAK